MNDHGNNANIDLYQITTGQNLIPQLTFPAYTIGAAAFWG